MTILKNLSSNTETPVPDGYKVIIGLPRSGDLLFNPITNKIAPITKSKLEKISHDDMWKVGRLMMVLRNIKAIKPGDSVVCSSICKFITYPHGQRILLDYSTYTTISTFKADITKLSAYIQPVLKEVQCNS